MHERVPTVGQSKPAGRRLGDMYREAIAVGEREVRAQHQRAVRTLVDPDLLAETLAQESSERIRVEGHRFGLGASCLASTPLTLKSSVRQASAPSTVSNRPVSVASASAFLPAAMAASDAQ